MGETVAFASNRLFFQNVLTLPRNVGQASPPISKFEGNARSFLRRTFLACKIEEGGRTVAVWSQARFQNRAVFS